MTKKVLHGFLCRGTEIKRFFGPPAYLIPDFRLSPKASLFEEYKILYSTGGPELLKLNNFKMKVQIV